MSKYQDYLKELEELSSYAESNEFEIDKYLIKAYECYKNGNFLAIGIIGDTCKLLYENLNDKEYLTLALNVFLLGPTNILDLDFTDQNNFLLRKGEFLAYYATEVDNSYKDKALETLNYYANTNSDGRHLRAKAMLEKPVSNDDILAMAMYKALLLEYFSYGNELTNEELEAVDIPSSYLAMNNEELIALVKENKNNNDELKKLYYVLLNKGNTSYAYDLAKIDNTFVLDYYIAKKKPFENPQSITKTKTITEDQKTTNSIKTFKYIFFVDIILTIIIRISRLPIFAPINNVMSVEPRAFSMVIIIVTLLIPLLLFVFRKSKALSITFGILSLLSALFYYTICARGGTIYGITIGVVIYVLVKIACAVCGFINASRCKKNTTVKN